jgi:hypothetical protein
LESHGSFFRLVDSVTNDIVGVPFIFLLVPDSNLDHGRILRHEEVIGYFNSDFNRVINHSHGGVREGDDLQAFFNREDATHSPLELSLRDFGVSVHAEVHNSTNDNVGAFLCECQVIETSPEVTDNNLHGGVLLGKRSMTNLLFLRSAGVKLEADTFVGHVLT